MGKHGPTNSYQGQDRELRRDLFSSFVTIFAEQLQRRNRDAAIPKRILFLSNLLQWFRNRGTESVTALCQDLVGFTVSLLFVCGPILFNRNRRERRWWPSLLTELRSRFSVAALKMIRRQKLQIAKLFKIKLRTFEFTTAIEVVNDLSLLSFRHRLARCWRLWNGSQLT